MSVYFFTQNQRKGADNVAVFRVEKSRDYTVMSNHHLRNTDLSLKSKGLLSQWHIHSGARKVLEESQGQAERTDFPQPGQKCPGRDAEGKGLHPGLAGLLRDCEHEDNHAGMGRLAAPPLQMLYLETMEETQDESKEPDEIGDAPVAGVGGEQLPESLLAHGEERSCAAGNLKRKTRTGRIR